jgi:hypothetical protein
LLKKAIRSAFGDHAGLVFPDSLVVKLVAVPPDERTTWMAPFARTIRVPSGDHDGEDAYVLATRLVGVPPAEGMTKRPVAFVYAIREPSGDHTGSVASVSVSSTRLLPSGSITARHGCPPALAQLAETNAIFPGSVMLCPLSSTETGSRARAVRPMATGLALMADLRMTPNRPDNVTCGPADAKRDGGAKRKAAAVHVWRARQSQEVEASGAMREAGIRARS